MGSINAQCPFYHDHDGGDDHGDDHGGAHDGHDDDGGDDGGDDDDFLTCTIVVVDPPGTGGSRQFSGFPSPRLPRVT